MSCKYLVDIHVHDLVAGSKKILESSDNGSGLEQGAMSHLHTKLRLKESRIYGLIGRNGSGKTTLLRAIASGKLDGISKELRFELVDQDACVDNETDSVMDLALGIDPEMKVLEEEMDTLDAEEYCDAIGDRLNEINERIVELEEARRPAQKRAQKLLRGLGFDDLKIPFAKLSGGWRMRAVLAAALQKEPQLLLLDEPTNHLDISAVTWLQHYLAKEFQGTVLCVSHDRAFINEIADEIIVLTGGHSLQYHVGDLDSLYKLANKMANQCERQQQNQQKQILLSQRKIERFEQLCLKNDISLSANQGKHKYGNYQGGGEKNASALVKKEYAKLERKQTELDGRGACVVDPVSLQVIESDDCSWAASLAPSFQSEDSALKFAFGEAEPLNLSRDMPMLELRGVSYRYPEGENNVLDKVDLSIGEKARIAITGKNGAGKSTLVQLLVGEIVPTSGDVARHPNLRIASFGQHDAESLQQKLMTPFQYLESSFTKMREHELFKQLHAFGITQEMMHRPLAELSGGQRMRVAFSKMCAQEPHILVLDEPTNHLDLYAIEALSDALREFEGSVVFVTHNRYLIEEVANSMIVVKANGIKEVHASTRDKYRFHL